MARNTRKNPGALGTVEQLPSGRYRAFYRKDGARFTAPVTFATKDDANAWLATERADRTRGIWHDPKAGRITVADYARAWMDSRPDLAARTRFTYQASLDNWVLPKIGGPRGIELGRLDLSSLTPAVIRSWYATMFTHARDRAAAMLSREAERAAHPARAWAKARGYAVADTGRLSPEVVRAWNAAGQPTPQSTTHPAVIPETAGRTAAAQAYRILRTILNTAVQDELIASNPCQIANAGVVHHRERTTASPVEVAELAAHMPPQFSTAVYLAAWSGLRYGELFALARRNVDLEAGTVRVERALLCVPGEPIRFGPTKTHKSNRVVHLPSFVTAALRTHLADFTGESADALLFTNSKGQPVSNLRVSFLFRRARAVIAREDLTWHDLRHTGATLAYRAGASVPEVQRRLGHSTMRAAAIYAHSADDSDQLLAERLDSMYGASEPLPRLRAV